MPIYSKRKIKMMFDLLIIDDDELFLILNKREVVKSGLHAAPLTFNSAQLGLNWLDDNDQEGRNVLILLDINMPQMDAWGFLKAMAQKPLKSHIKIYIVTSSSDPKDKILAESYPNVLGLLEKPVSRDVLFTISNHLFNR